jgi:hypothetical protein
VDPRPSIEAGLLRTPLGGALRTLADAADHVALAFHHGQQAIGIVRRVFHDLKTAWTLVKANSAGKDQ